MTHPTSSISMFVMTCYLDLWLPPARKSICAQDIPIYCKQIFVVLQNTVAREQEKISCVQGPILYIFDFF